MASSAPLPRITVLGSLNIDLVAYVPHHPLPGETLTANSFAVSPGGKGANQAVACAKLSRPRITSPPSTTTTSSTDETKLQNPTDEGASAHVSMVGCVGTDSYGTLLRTNLATHGVDVRGVAVRPGLKTGVAIIIVDEPSGQNRIVLSPEANHVLQPADVGTLASLLGEPLPDLLIMQLEIPIPTVIQAVKAAGEAGVAVLLNPAPAVPLPGEVFEGLAHLVVNETEAAILGGVEERVLDEEDGMERVSRGFLEKGVSCVIITLGGRGVYFMAEGGKRKGLLPAEKAKVVDTTAAGDTFVGQYALEVVSAGKGEFDVEAAVRKSNRAAAKTVERMGAQISIPWRDELA